MEIEAICKGMVHRTLPDANPEYTEEEFRTSRYGEKYIQSVVPTKHVLCDEGTYFMAQNPTPGTALSFAVNAAVSETAGNFLHIFNTDSVTDTPNNKRLYLDYIRLIAATPPAAATSGHAFVKIDFGTRYTSGGTLLANVNPNMDSGRQSVAQVYAGALTTAAPSTRSRQAGRAVLSSVIPVANDEYILHFGGIDNSDSTVLAGTSARRIMVPMAPVVIGPQQCACVQLWFPANATTAGTFEVEAGWFER